MQGCLQRLLLLPANIPPIISCYMPPCLQHLPRPLEPFQHVSNRLHALRELTFFYF